MLIGARLAVDGLDDDENVKASALEVAT